MRYSQTLIDHFRNPRNAGVMRDPDGVGEAEDRDCMDLARVYLRIRRGRVVEARFQTYGCGPAIAASSAGTELIVGLPLSEIEELQAGRVEAAVGGLPDDRRHAAEVVSAAIRAAARDGRARADAGGTANDEGGASRA